MHNRGNSHDKKKNIHVLLSGVIALALLWKGLYFYHMAYTIGAILIGILLGYFIKNKGIYIEKSLNHIVLLVGVGLYFVTIFFMPSIQEWLLWER